MGVIKLKEIFLKVHMICCHRSGPQKLSLDNITSFMLPCTLALRESSQISIELLQIKRKTYVRFNLAWIFPSAVDDIKKLFFTLRLKHSSDLTLYLLEPFKTLKDVKLNCSNKLAIHNRKRR